MRATASFVPGATLGSPLVRMFEGPPHWLLVVQRRVQGLEEVDDRVGNGGGATEHEHRRRHRGWPARAGPGRERQPSGEPAGSLPRCDQRHTTPRAHPGSCQPWRPGRRGYHRSPAGLPGDAVTVRPAGTERQAGAAVGGARCSGSHRERPYFSCWRMRAVATRSLPPERSASKRKKIGTRFRSFGSLGFGPEKLPIVAKSVFAAVTRVDRRRDRIAGRGKCATVGISRAELPAEGAAGTELVTAVGEDHAHRAE